MNLTLDIGNTRSKICVFEEKFIIFEKVYDELDVEKTISLLKDWPIINSISSTVGKPNKKVIEILKKRTNYFELKNELSLPIDIDYKTPKTLGKDRIATAVGAYLLYPKKTCLIIDAGTCITLDILTKGIFKGGNISPGIMMRLKAMHEYTSSLPLVKFEDSNFDLGQTTKEAVANGGILGAICEVEAFIMRCQDKYDDLVILITGGDRKIFQENLSSSLISKSHLLDFGLNNILEHQLEK